MAINAAHGVRVIGRREEGSKKIKPPSKEAVAALLAEADDDLRLIVMFAAATGLRASELWALRWRHLDLTRREVTIETRVDCYRQEDTTKTAAGVRQIPLGADLVIALKAWRLRSRYSQDADLVFTDRRRWNFVSGAESSRRAMSYLPSGRIDYSSSMRPISSLFQTAPRTGAVARRQA